MGCESSKQHDDTFDIEQAQLRDLQARVAKDKGRITLRAAAMAVRVASVRNPLMGRSASLRRSDGDAKRASLLGQLAKQQGPSSVNPTTGYAQGVGSSGGGPSFNWQQKTASTLSNRSAASDGGRSSAGATTSTMQTSYATMLTSTEVTPQPTTPPGDMDVQSISDEDDLPS